MRLKKSIIKDFIAILLGSAIILTMSKGIPFFIRGKVITVEAQTLVQNIETSESQETYTGIDVIAIGNSDLYSAFDPQQLWDEQGISSYVAAGPNANLCTSYHMLEGVLACQKPQLVILEVDEFFEEKNLYYLQSTSNLAYENCYSLFSQFDYLLKCPIINQSTITSKRVSVNKGFYRNTTVVPYYGGFSYMVESDERAAVNSVTETYLSQFIELARAYGCEILMVCMPSASSWTYAKHNTVSDYAEEYDIPFIDFNIDQFDTGFDWLTDTRDGGNHLNSSGAQKITSYLGEYIKENYDLTDHRGDTAYSEWE